MTTPRDIRTRLGRLAAGPDEAIDLVETALLLARLRRPSSAVAPYHRHLERLVGDTARIAGDDPDVDQAAAALRHVIARRYGYRGGDTPPELEDYDLMRVIDHRAGSAAALGLLYLHVARSLGWSIEGIDFPIRLLIRLERGHRRVLLDPLDGGRAIDATQMRALLKATLGNHAELEPHHYAVLGNRAILLRLQNGIKLHCLRHERLAEALEAIETMLVFAPDMAPLWREAGMIHVRLDNPAAAVAALEEYMRRRPDDDARYRTSALLEELRTRLR